MTESQLLDLAQRAGIPADSPKLEALKLKYLHELSDYEAARRTGVNRQTVRYAVHKVEWVLSAQGNPRPLAADRHETPQRMTPQRMTPERLDALCDLAGRIGNGATRIALHHHYVAGKSKAASALLANVHGSTVSNACRLIELQDARLPALAETVRRAQG